MKFDEIWEIEKFLVLDSAISSQTFCAGRGIWKIKLFPLGNPGKTDGQHVAVYLQLVDLSSLKSTRNQGIFATPRFFILDGNGNKIWSQRKAGYEAKERRFLLLSHCATIFGYKNFIARKHLMGTNNQLLPGGKLTLRCQLHIREGCRDVDDAPPLPESILDFSRLVNLKPSSSSPATASPPTYADVTFHVDGAEIECHKAIVSRKSKIFKQFFMAYDNEAFHIDCEQKFGLVLKAPIFQDALLHVYGSTPRILSIPFQKFSRSWALNVKKITSLMLLASEYEIKDLTQICESKLIELFRTRSLDLAKKVKRGKKGRTRDPDDYFLFENKPFSLLEMTQIANHVTASCLSVYLDTCQQRVTRVKQEPKD